MPLFYIRLKVLASVLFFAHKFKHGQNLWRPRKYHRTLGVQMTHFTPMVVVDYDYQVG